MTDLEKMRLELSGIERDRAALQGTRRNLNRQMMEVESEIIYATTRIIELTDKIYKADIMSRGSTS